MAKPADFPPIRFYPSEDEARTIVRRLLDERLLVKRTPTGDGFADDVRVTWQVDPEIRPRPFVLQQRFGGSLTSWRSLLAMLVEELTLDAMRGLNIVTPAAPASTTERRTAWERLITEET